jgi:hypothetical protein
VSVRGLGRTLQVVVGSGYAGTRAVRVAAPGGGPRADGVSAAGAARTAAGEPCS